MLAGADLSDGDGLTARTIDAARSLKDTALVTSATGSSAHTLRLNEVAPGAGDLATAMYAAPQPEAPQHRLAHVAGTMFDMVTAVRLQGLPELPLVQCQELIVAPRSAFTPVPAPAAGAKKRAACALARWPRRMAR